MAGPIGLWVVGVDSHDAPVVPIRCPEVRDSRSLPIGHSADSVADDRPTCINRPVPKPCIFMEREGVEHVTSICNCSGRQDYTCQTTVVSRFTAYRMRETMTTSG